MQRKTIVSNALPKNTRSAALDEALEYLVRILAPIAPHLCDELWEALGFSGFLYKNSWPVSDSSVAKADEITLIVQINGKVRDKMTVSSDADNEMIINAALSSPRIKEILGGATPKKVIPVAGKLVNIVV